MRSLRFYSCVMWVLANLAWGATLIVGAFNVPIAWTDQAALLAVAVLSWATFEYSMQQISKTNRQKGQSNDRE